MLRKVFSFSGMLLLVGAAIIATPGLSQAQRGGGHGGGAHIGGARIGGGHIGCARIGGGNFGGARFGGFHSGGFRGGYAYPHDGYHNYYRPYYGSYGYDHPYYNSYPYVWSSPTYDSGYSGSYGDVAPSYPDDYGSVTPPAGSYQSFYPPATAEPEPSAAITVTVPAVARVWFGGTLTTSTGPIREFYSPPLTPGSKYTYAIRASWNENGQEVTQTQQVRVTAGAHANVSFPVPAKPTGAAVK